MSSNGNGNGTLEPKQLRFVEEFAIDCNATQAAIRAGYSQRTARQIGYENLTKPLIREAIETKLQRHIESIRTRDVVPRAKSQLYFILNPITSLIKIGVSADIEGRLRVLETASGCPLRLLAVWPHAHLEKSLHVAFAGDRRLGEWFVADRILQLLLPEVTI